MKQITLKDVKDTIAFEKDSIEYIAAHGVVDTTYNLAKIEGKTEHEASKEALYALADALNEDKP